MLRVCGVTYDHTVNYGSCFQAFALQETIKQMVICGDTCSYDLLPFSTFPDRKLPIVGKTGLKGKVIRRITRFMNRQRRKKFVEFENHYMSYANFRSKKELGAADRCYDAFVCGSDVIWNFDYTRGDETYFLDFTNKYKFSYAASFGKLDLSYKDENLMLDRAPEEIYRTNISQLNSVSVRETDAVKLAARFTEKPVDLVLDPVLLRTADEWRSLFPSEGAHKKYIFAYSTSTRPNYVRFLERIKKQTGLPVINITWLIKDAFRQRAFRFESPDKWLQLLADAEYVVTNSFHATAFSVIFKKKFFTVIQGERNVRSNIRLYNFLESLRLSDRIITDIHDTIDEGEPDFSYSDELIKAEKTHSLRFLQENLEAAYRAKLERENGSSAVKADL